MRAKTDFASFETSGWGRSDDTLLDRLASTPGLAANEVLRYTRVLGGNVPGISPAARLSLSDMFDANQGDAASIRQMFSDGSYPAIYAGDPRWHLSGSQHR